MDEALVIIGAIAFVFCFIMFVFSLIQLIVSAFIKDVDKKPKIFNSAKKILLFSLIGGVVGFGVCASNFSLGTMH